MKYILPLILSLCACGGSGISGAPSTSTVTWTGEIVWEGWVTDNPESLAAFHETAACVGENTVNATIPYLIEIDGLIQREGQELADFGVCDFYNSQIVMNYCCPDWVFRHEVIHWLTLKGEEIHNTPLMLTCSEYYSNP